MLADNFFELLGFIVPTTFVIFKEFIHLLGNNFAHQLFRSTEGIIIDI